MCMFSLGDFIYSFFAGGGRGVWVATKWDFFLGGGGVMFGVFFCLCCFGGLFDTYILRKGCGAKQSVDCMPT